jgi:hypothetical protein
MVSRYSEVMRARREENDSMESLSFLRSPATTEVRVRSVEEPGPYPGRERAVGGVGAVQGPEKVLDNHGFLDDRGDLGIHAGTECAHRRCVVQPLALLVAVVERALDALQVLELVIDGLHVLEEPVQARSRRHRHLHAAPAAGLDVVAGVHRRAGEEVSHGGGRQGLM